MTKICVRCQARKALKGFSRCARCREADRVYWRSLRAERRKDGLCPDCGRKRASGRTYCSQHLEYYAEAARAYKQRKAKATKKAAPAATAKATVKATAKKKKTAR
ncbi:MAG TPA: hypothetical protein VK509_11215 [Polyangiales bacterium]|nr:hypothetical protein [Polyangiales bacterium]